MKKLDIFYVISIIIWLLCAIYVLFIHNRWVWVQVLCDFDAPNEVSWKVTYSDWDYIVVSWVNKIRMWLTWWQRIDNWKCDWCTEWVNSVSYSWWETLYDYQYSETFILKTFECIRQNKQSKNKDLIKRVKFMSE